MQQYSKPTVTKLGTVTQKTEGGYKWEVNELMSKRGAFGS
jgi:hypothetical protein